MKKLSMTRREKKNLIRILIALCLFAIIFVLDKILELDGVFGGELGWLFPFALYLAVYLIIGYDVLWKAVRNISHGQI
ncbi:MAG: heavy metal translocating P-type ATPase, partial [Firmicutes bacterium]|nr:heavy metal translocating P-type ATPase [Bacillota bacterium]